MNTLNTKRSQDKMTLKRLADTYWEESIIPIQGRLAELTVLIKTEASREERFRLKARRTALRRMRNELEATAVYLEHYYRSREGDA